MAPPRGVSHRFWLPAYRTPLMLALLPRASVMASMVLRPPVMPTVRVVVGLLRDRCMRDRCTTAPVLKEAPRTIPERSGAKESEGGGKRPPATYESDCRPMNYLLRLKVEL